MEFRIADTFTTSLARLTADEQKVAKTTAFDLQVNHANPGIQLHRVDRSRDKNFWSARISRDLRLIVHRTDSALMPCYADHHDAAYRWAERRVLERHPTTGAAQLVEVRAAVREIEVPRYVVAEEVVAPAELSSSKPPLFVDVPDDDLLGRDVQRDAGGCARGEARATGWKRSRRTRAHHRRRHRQGRHTAVRGGVRSGDAGGGTDAPRAPSGGFARATDHVTAGSESPYDFIVVDESQDISVPQLPFLAALRGEQEDGLFFAGDIGQRIFQTPFSWRSLGIGVRGRSHTLRINYRTSHQIRMAADLLLPAEMSDVDGNTETRRGTVSAFNGPEPRVEVVDSAGDETATIANWLKARLQDGLQAEEIGVFVRSHAQVDRARAALRAAGLDAGELGAGPDDETGRVAVGLMHLAKGLEFRAVGVAACDDDVIPLQTRVEDIADGAELENVYNTERHLLYVDCTRARDHLLVTGVAPGSEFLDDLRPQRIAGT